MLANTEYSSIYVLPESEWSEMPTDSLALVRAIPVTSASGGKRIERKRPNPIRRDRQLLQSLRVSSHAEFRFDFELHGTVFETLMAACIGTRFQPTTGLIGLAGAWVDGVLNAFVTSEVNWVEAGVVVGGYIYSAGFAQAANNGIFEVTELTTTVMTVNGDLITESNPSEEANLMVGFVGNMARNNTTRQSFFFEQSYVDISAFDKYHGMYPTSLSLNISSRNLITGSMAFLGADTITESSSILTSTCQPKETDALYVSSGTLRIIEDGIDITAPVFSISFITENNSSTLFSISQLSPYAILEGNLAVTGSMVVYFNSIALKNKFLNNTATSLILHLESVTRQRMVISFPSVLLLSGDTPLTGRETDVFLATSWEASMGGVSNYTIQFDSFDSGNFDYFVISGNAPSPEYFIMKDQVGVTWYFWFDSAGQITRGSVAPTFLYEIPINLTPGTIPYWHQVTDEGVGTWYLYPSDLGELQISNGVPTIGTGLVTGLGLQAVGRNHVTYRLGARSWQEWVVESISGTSTVTRWFYWINENGVLVHGTTPPNYYPGFIHTDLFPGTPPAWYQFSELETVPIALTTGTIPYWHQVTDEGVGTWYLYPDENGQMVISNAAPSIGTGLVAGLGLEVAGRDRTQYRLGARSWQEWVVETTGTPVSLPEYFAMRSQDGVVWYLWFDWAGQLVISQYETAALGVWYVYPNISGDLTVNTAPPATGIGHNKGTGFNLWGVDKLHYKLDVDGEEHVRLTLLSGPCA